MNGAAARSLAIPLTSGAAALLTGAWLLATLTWPFGWDQGIFAWVGSVIRDGGLPYRDAVDLKGPLPYYVYAAAQSLLGHNTWGIRLVDAGIMVLAGVSLHSVVQRLAGRTWAFWAACSLLLWMGSLGFWGTAQPDGWVAALLLGAFALMVSDGSTVGAARIAGAATLCGVAGLVKPFYGAFAILPVLYPWLPFSTDRKPSASSEGDDTKGIRSEPEWNWGRQRWTASLLAMFSSILPVLVVVAWFRWHGALDAAVEVHLRFTASSYSGMTSGIGVGRVIGLLELLSRTTALPFALPAIAAGVLAGWHRHRVVAGLLLAWLLLALGFVALQGRFYAYQLLPAYPPFVAFAVLGFQAVLGRSGDTPKKGLHRPWQSPLGAFLLMSLALVLAAVALRPVLDTVRAARYTVGAVSQDTYYESFSPLMSFNAADELRLAHVLRERSDADDRVGVLGWNVGLLYLTDRPSASRFGFSPPFTHDTTTALGRRFQDEFLRDLEGQPPPWMVVGAIHGGRASLQERLESLPRVGGLLTRRYCISDEIGHYVLFRREDLASDAPAAAIGTLPAGVRRCPSSEEALRLGPMPPLPLSRPPGASSGASRSPECCRRSGGNGWIW